MKDINKMSIRELDEYLGLQIEYIDLPYIIKKDNIFKEVFEKLGKYYRKEGAVPIDKLVDFLVENEKYVDKDRLILVNYYEHIYVQEIQKTYIMPNEIKELKTRRHSKSKRSCRTT